MKPRILVVEDENAIRIALKGLLTREGYEVDLAVDGESAIEQLSSRWSSIAWASNGTSSIR